MQSFIKVRLTADGAPHIEVVDERVIQWSSRAHKYAVQPWCRTARPRSSGNLTSENDKGK